MFKSKAEWMMDNWFGYEHYYWRWNPYLHCPL